ncbi:hypothetical protein X474_21630 [Dethiosulfatarculus sandiegensis]|uniref:Uncharacterized protein n=1 Tax=Dethiosulfatarculus sandiegensis TaxID=1429043 RepID=A0A0D2J132_9BACT|nr:hypothetical protein X474_21630 [Dethiosulfatarculus sandiegensis]
MRLFFPWVEKTAFDFNKEAFAGLVISFFPFF